MRFLLLLVLSISIFAFAESSTKNDSVIAVKEAIVPSETFSIGTPAPVTTIAPANAQDTIIDTIYVIHDDGIPWNREHFDPERLVRHDTFDPALKVAYTYSISFIGGSLGSFAQQSFMAHFAYEFTPNFHLYADIGLWMPLYSNLRFGTPIAREDVRQGSVGFLIPDIMLEYKPTDIITLRVAYINERDAFKAYGTHRFFYESCPPWRNSIFCR